MAQFTKVNSDFQPVLHLDAAEYQNLGLNSLTANVTVQPQGPKLDFFTVTMATLTSNVTIASQVVLTVQELATIHMYEFGNGASETLALAVYPTGAWTAATLQASCNAATGLSGTVAATATFTN